MDTPENQSGTGVFTPGTTLDGRYRIRRPIGAGGMGSIFIAEHLKFGRDVAIKVLSSTGQEDVRAQERFLREAKAVCHLQHPNLVTYHDFGTDTATGIVYLVLELLKGRDLASILQDQRQLPLHRVIHILTQLSDALSEAHMHGVIHRDLKPANVMLVRRGEDSDFVKLIDFGIVRVMQEEAQGDELTSVGMIVGTPGYIAPEYIQFQHVDHRVDVYALGVIAYELLAGRRPFVHERASEVLRMHVRAPVPKLLRLHDGRIVPDELNRVVTKSLAKDPDKRFSSVREFKEHILTASLPLLDDVKLALTIEGNEFYSAPHARDEGPEIAVSGHSDTAVPSLGHTLSPLVTEASSTVEYGDTTTERSLVSSATAPILVTPVNTSERRTLSLSQEPAVLNIEAAPNGSKSTEADFKVKAQEHLKSSVPAMTALVLGLLIFIMVGWWTSRNASPTDDRIRPPGESVQSTARTATKTRSDAATGANIARKIVYARPHSTETPVSRLPWTIQSRFATEASRRHRKTLTEQIVLADSQWDAKKRRHDSRAKRRSSVRTEPTKNKDTIRYQVQITARPYGIIRYQGRVIGEDFANELLPPGRACFQLGPDKKMSCRQINGPMKLSLPAK